MKTCGATERIAYQMRSSMLGSQNQSEKTQLRLVLVFQNRVTTMKRSLLMRLPISNRATKAFVGMGRETDTANPVGKCAVRMVSHVCGKAPLSTAIDMLTVTIHGITFIDHPDP